MAAETPVIEIKTLEAVKSVQDLKNNIKELKKQLDTLEIGTDKYKSTLKDLKVNQAALKNAMYGTSASFKDVAQAATAANIQFDSNNKIVKAETLSYNELVTKMAELKMEWRNVTDETQRANLGEQINSVNDRLKELDSSVGNFSRNVGNYRGSLEGLSVSLGGLKQVGDGFNQGITAMVSTLGSLGIAADEDNRAMKSWAVTLALINSAEGLVKGIDDLGKWIAQKKDAAQAEAQDTVAIAQNTTVTRENTVAKEINDKATKKLTVDVNILKLALGGIAALLGGMLIANFDKVSSAARGFLVNLGLINGELDAGRFSVESYKDEQKKLNAEFEKQIAIMGAQGLPQQDIIEAKINHWRESLQGAQGDIQDINQELTETEIKTNRTVRTVQVLHPVLGTVAKLFKGVGRWLAGTDKAYKELNETLSAVTENEKTFQENLEQAEFEKQLEGIREQTEKNREAAAKALEEAKRKAEELAQIITKATDKSKEAITETLSPVEKIKQEYKEQLDMLHSGLTALDKQAKSGKNLEDIAAKRKTIEEGILALQRLEAKELNEQTSKEFERIIDVRSKYYKFLFEDQQAGFSRITSVMKNSLGYTDAQIELIFQNSKAYSNELQQQLSINRQLLKAIEQETNGYKGLREGMESYFGFATDNINDLLSDAFLFSNDNPDEFAKTFSEPLATAIKRAYEITLSNENLKRSMLDIVASVNDEIFNKAINDNDSSAAFEQAAKFISGISSAYKAFFGEEPPQELSDAFATYQKNMFEKSFEVLINGDFNAKNAFNVGKKLIDAMFPEGTEDYLHKRVEAWMEVINSVTQSYGNTTANMLGSIGSMWDNYLKLRYKNQVESGRKSEKEAKAEAENAFKNVKALQIATAVISTSAAVVQALSDPTVPSYFLKAANAVAALAAGTAQVMQIKMTEFGAPSVKDGGFSEPKLVDRTPQLNYVVGLNPQDYVEAQTQNPIRAYIVDKDVADGIDQYRKREDETTF